MATRSQAGKTRGNRTAVVHDVSTGAPSRVTLQTRVPYVPPSWGMLETSTPSRPGDAVIDHRIHRECRPQHGGYVVEVALLSVWPTNSSCPTASPRPNGTQAYCAVTRSEMLLVVCCQLRIPDLPDRVELLQG